MSNHTSSSTDLLYSKLQYL